MCFVRDYHAADYEACLGIFASNVPSVFGVAEQADFAGFLTRLRCPYFVAELSGAVVGCGGYYLVLEEGLAGLAWGMVAHPHQRRGVGSALLGARLQRLTSEPAIHTVRVNTSQHAVAFFQRFGFQTTGIVENRFSDGIHLHQMFLPLVPRGAVSVA